MIKKIKGNLSIIILFMLLITIAYLVIDFGAAPLYGSIMCGEGTCICMCIGTGCTCSYSATGCSCRCDSGSTDKCSTGGKDPQPPKE